MKKYFFLTTVFLILSLLFLSSVKAAELYLLIDKKPVDGNVKLKVDVRLHSNNEEINAVEATLYYPEKLELDQTSLQKSFINLWIKGPVLEKSSVPGFKAIAMSGLTPGGVAVSGSSVASFVFSVPTTVPSDIPLLFSLKNARVLLNDGKGTATNLTLKNATVQTSSKINESLPLITAEIPFKDTTPPEPFTVVVVKNANLFNNRWFAAFNALDQESGIERYQIQEVKTNFPDETKWVDAQNPAELNDQSLESYIFVRAFDRAGNYRDSFYAPESVQLNNSYSKIVIGCILIVVVVVLLVRLFVLIKKRGNVHEQFRK